MERRKENEELRRQEEQRRRVLRRAEVLRRVKELHRLAEEQQRIREEQQRIREEQLQQLMRNQMLDKELSETQLKYPNETYRSCVLKLCKKYHPDKNPNADPECIRILNHMKQLLA